MADPTSAALAQLVAELRSFTATIRQNINAQSSTLSATLANKAHYEEINKQLEIYIKDQVKGRKLTKEQQVLLAEAAAAKRKEIEATQKLIAEKKLEAAVLKRYPGDQQKAATASRLVTTAQNQLAQRAGVTAKASQLLQSSFSTLTKGTNLASAALVWFGSTLRNQADQLIKQYKTAGGVVEGTSNIFGSFIDSQTQALKYGLSGDDLQRISAASRQTVNAMGGTQAAFKQMEPAIGKFRSMTLDSVEAAEMATKAARYFAESGIRPTTQNMEAYRSELVQLRAQTGMSNKEAQEFFESMSKDVDVIDQLRSARLGERNAILASQRALVSQAIASGQTAEQAREAAKMLNKMVAAKPLDRLRQAAKIRALGGAMGIAGSEEAAQGVVAGKNATAEQKQAIMQFSQSAANAMDKAAGQGIGSEIFATTLLDKLNLDEYYGKGSAFSTTLGDTLKPLEGVMQKYVDVARTTQGEAAGHVALLKNQAELIISGNNYLGVIAAGVASIAAMLLTQLVGGKLLGGLTSVLSRLLPAAATGVAAETAIAGSGAAGLTAARGAGVAGKLAGGARILGPIAALGTGAYEGYDEYQRTGKAGRSVGKGVGTAGGGLAGGWAGAAGGAAMGAAIGSVVPIVGTIAGGLIGALLGGLGGGLLGGSLGGKAGTYIGSKFDNEDDTITGSAQISTKQRELDVDSSIRTAAATSDIKTATMATADGITAQVKKLDTSNDLLKLIADLQQKAVDLAEKQLVALTLTDKEKQDSTVRTILRRDNTFSTRYNYI